MRSRSAPGSAHTGVTAEATLRPALERLLRPRSVAVVGISKEPGSLGQTQVENFDRFGFTGALHLVSRNRTQLGERACVASIDDLPAGIDAAVLCVPRAGVIDSLEALARRGVGSAMIFASGFAEQDDAGRRDQERIVAIAAATGMAVNGPNCLGLTNYVDGIPYAFSASEPHAVPRARVAAAVVTQSGATMSNVSRALMTRGVNVSYQMSTGNEAVLSIEDHLAFVLDDDRDGPVALFAEQIRHPQRFLALAKRAADRGRHLVLLHPGTSEGARAAALSHTGAIAGDDAAMRTAVSDAGVLLVDDLDMLIDAVAILARYPIAPRRGVAVSSDSGAMKSIVLDECAALGLPLPAFDAPAFDAIHAALPSFAVVSNPLDLTAQCIYDPLLYERSAHAMLGDPNVGSFLAVIQPGPNLRWLRENKLFDEMRATEKPALVALPHGDSRWPDDLIAQMIEREIVFTNTCSQAVRALAAITAYGVRRARLAQRTPPAAVTARAHGGSGALTEAASKAIVAAYGIAVPAGEFVRHVDAGRAAASRIGYPVVLKVQAAALTHKSDAGAVAVGIADEAAFDAAWERMTENVHRALPGLAIDGYLVEAMGAPGLEMIVGARRDPQWGIVMMAGLGGIWTEALGDVALFAEGADRTQIRAGLEGLKGARLLAGMRGAPAVDVDALAKVVLAAGAVLRADAAMLELDLNPVLAYPPGRAPLALDALIVMRSS